MKDKKKSARSTRESANQSRAAARESANQSRAAADQGVQSTRQAWKYGREELQQAGEAMRGQAHRATWWLQDELGRQPARASAMLECSGIIGRGMQQITSESLNYSERSLQYMVQAGQNLIGCRTWTDVLALQHHLARDATTGMLRELQRISDISARTAKDALDRLEETAGEDGDDDAAIAAGDAERERRRGGEQRQATA